MRSGVRTKFFHNRKMNQQKTVKKVCSDPARNLIDIMTTRLRKIFLALLACVALDSTCVAAENSELFEKAADAFARRDYGTIITCMDAVLKNDPRTASAYAYRGAAYEAKLNLNAAITNYSEGVRLSPNDADLRYYLGTALGKRGDFESALSNLDEAIRLDPKHGKAYASRGAVFQMSGKLEKAISDYDIAVRLAPDCWETHFGRAHGYDAQGEFHKAIDDYNEAIQLLKKGDSPSPYNSLGWLLATCQVQSVRNGAHAVAAARKACELTDWKNPDYIDTLAAAYAEAGDFEKAIKYEKQAVSTDGLTDQNRSDAQKRMGLYQQQKPYHQAPNR
jgi:tetratricopeptide (TPR) repeat protein